MADRLSGWAVLSVSLAVGVAALATAVPAMGQLIANPRLGSPTRGARVFSGCSECHSLEPGKNGIGPSLSGLFGRKAGSVPGFNYSPATKRLPIVWDEDSLSEFLTNPRMLTRDRKLRVHTRIEDPTQVGDLLAYLAQASR